MSAAHQALRTARRTGSELAITVLERSTHTSYSACGIPYWMAGDVDSGDDLVARTAERHRAAGIDLRLGTEAVAADLAARTVTTAAGEVLDYDELVVATGAPAIVPDWALRPRRHAVRHGRPGQDARRRAAWLDRFDAAGDGAHVVVVGAGYIGVEVAEAALRRGLGVTVLTRGHGLALLEDEMSERVAVALCDAGAEVVLGVEVTGLEVDGDRVTGVHWDGGTRDADLVVLAIGVRPGTAFLDGSGLETADNGALRPDPHGRVAEHVWAAGDCCEVRRRVDDRWVFRPLGTHATKHGRALGDSLAGGTLSFPGVVDTSITRFAAGGEYLEIARTGPGPRGGRGSRAGPGHPRDRGEHRERLHARGRPGRPVGDGRPGHPATAGRAGRGRPRRRQARRRRGGGPVGRRHGRRPGLDGPRLRPAVLDGVGRPADRRPAGGRTVLSRPGHPRGGHTPETALRTSLTHSATKASAMIAISTLEWSLLRHSAGVRSVLSSHSSVTARNGMKNAPRTP